MNLRKNPLPSIEDLRSAFSYSPETGELHWKEDQHRSVRGQIAGCLNQKIGRRQVGFRGCILYDYRICFAVFHGRWPNGMLDHADGNPLNNRISNLREATPTQNSTNSKKPVTNTSGLKGCYWLKNAKKWRASIQYLGKFYHLGLYATAEEAHQAYCVAAAKLHGEFARTT